MPLNHKYSPKFSLTYGRKHSTLGETQTRNNGITCSPCLETLELMVDDMMEKMCQINSNHTGPLPFQVHKVKIDFLHFDSWE
ncbi:unnamed protein product [Sphenostylis stenocarpa]|uniref:Uncharacterized protein n=1 Tax=Sphenostylis stenocarpa TaxID=92480 RepID=A0AA86VV92_9FABA|nr:unnamed protein product [Sphenostylis stenocarpa]